MTTPPKMMLPDDAFNVHALTRVKDFNITNEDLPANSSNLSQTLGENVLTSSGVSYMLPMSHKLREGWIKCRPYYLNFCV